MSENLSDGLQRELARCRELLIAYNEIGPSGIFGKGMIEADIGNAEQAILSGDLPAMIAAYKELELCC